jgi:hypothetical protein
MTGVTSNPTKDITLLKLNNCKVEVMDAQLD